MPHTFDSPHRQHRRGQATLLFLASLALIVVMALAATLAHRDATGNTTTIDSVTARQLLEHRVP